MMETTAIDLKYNVNAILEALDRNEKVTILHQGVVKGFIIPAKRKPSMKMEDHPFFGMNAKSSRSVSAIVNELRAVRCNDI